MVLVIIVRDAIKKKGKGRKEGLLDLMEIKSFEKF